VTTARAFSPDDPAPPAEDRWWEEPEAVDVDGEEVEPLRAHDLPPVGIDTFRKVSATPRRLGRSGEWHSPERRDSALANALADVGEAGLIVEEATGAPTGRPSTGTRSAEQAGGILAAMTGRPLSELRAIARARGRPSKAMLAAREDLAAVVFRVFSDRRATAGALAGALGSDKAVRTLLAAGTKRAGNPRDE
jgi:hypothetical protein